MPALNKKNTLTVLALAFSVSISAQTVSEQTGHYLKEAGQFHKNYLFKKAESLYNKALEGTTDSVARMDILNRIIECQNGENLLEYIVRPKTIATGDFPARSFFLHLGEFPQGSWKPVPNPFVKPEDGQKHPYYSAVYFPDGNDRIIFSAPDQTGAWNIYTSYKKDSTWSIPQFLSENVLSGRNEIYPMLSADGKTLYFASDGMAGMGGYDLFRSRWDEELNDWGIPENLGFPYSSTGDDIFYYDTPDGRFSIVVSNREISGDSVRIYITQALTTPVKTPLREDESALRIASLDVITPEAAPLDEEKEATPKDEAQESSLVSDNDIENYSRLVKNLRDLQSDYREKLSKIEESRSIYERSSEQDKEFLAGIIRDVEAEALQIKRKIDEAAEQIRRTETEFLARGIIPEVREPEQQEAAVKAEQNTETPEYRFQERSMGSIPFLVVETPKPKFDYTFRITKGQPGKFVEDNTLPEGLVYQIQFMVLSSPATIKDIRGMSPVFVTKLPSGKYLHTVGLFRTYAEALSNLNKVKKNGFSQAFIVAYDSGKSLSVKQARVLENTRANAKPEIAYQVIINGYTSLPDNILTAIRGACDKDITKTASENGQVFVVGPFSDKSDADLVVSVIKNSGAKDVVLENIKLK